MEKPEFPTPFENFRSSGNCELSGGHSASPHRPHHSLLPPTQQGHFLWMDTHLVILWMLEGLSSVRYGLPPLVSTQGSLKPHLRGHLPFLCDSLELSNMLPCLPGTQLRPVSPDSLCDGASLANLSLEKVLWSSVLERVEQFACWQRAEPHARGSCRGPGRAGPSSLEVKREAQEKGRAPSMSGVPLWQVRAQGQALPLHSGLVP